MGHALGPSPPRWWQQAAAHHTIESFGDHSQLVVEESECAVFTRQGRAFGACAASWLGGNYFTLETIGGAGPSLAQAIMPHCAFFGEVGLELTRIDQLSVRVRS